MLIPYRIESILYKNILLSSSNEYFDGCVLTAKFQVPLEHKPASFFNEHVRNVFIMPSVPGEFLARLLAVCTGLEMFSCQLRVDGAPLLQAALPKLPEMKMLTVDFKTLHSLFGEVFQTKTVIPELPSVEYLNIMFRAEDEPLVPLGIYFPNLKHLRVDINRRYGIAEDLTAILDSVPTVQSIRMIVPNEMDWDNPPTEVWRAKDSRVIIEDQSEWEHDPLAWRNRVTEGVFWVKDE